MGFPVLGGLAAAVLKKVGPKVAKAIGGALGIGAAGAAVNKGVQVVKSGSAPPPPPLPGGIDEPYAYPTSGGITSPGGSPIGTGIVPSGSGFGAAAANAVLTGAIPMTAPPRFETVMRAPKGYALITLPDGRGVAVLKEVAYALGLRKRPRKTTAITSRDLAGARKVQGFIEKHSVKRVPRTPLKRIGKGKR